MADSIPRRPFPRHNRRHSPRQYLRHNRRHSPRHERLGDHKWNNQWRNCLRGHNWSSNKTPRRKRRPQTKTLPLLMVNSYSLRHRLARVLPSDLKLPELLFERPGQQERSSLRSSLLLRHWHHTCLCIRLFPRIRLQLWLRPRPAAAAAADAANVHLTEMLGRGAVGLACLVQLWMLQLSLLLLMHTYGHTSTYYPGEVQRAAWGSVVMIRRLHWH